MKLLVTGGLGFIGSNFIVNTLQNNKEIKITNVDAEFHGSNHANHHYCKIPISINLSKATLIIMI